MARIEVPVPEDWLADLSDEEQFELIEPTDNSLAASDEELPQPEPETAS